MRQLIILLLLVLAPCAWAQRVITGVVVEADSNNDPLPGATVSVSVPGSKAQAGAVTDYEGRFKLEVGAKVTSFTVRYLGYQTEEVRLVDGQTHYNIQLKPNARTVNEVVVTGYQKIDRRKLTAAVTKVDISTEKVGAVKSIDQALSGQIAGLAAVASSGAPGAPVKIRIRGTASLNGSQEPLWVLDGMPLEGTDIPSMDDLKDIDNIYQTSIAGINPADIDNITVLKDAAATAIYGARAANGVIVITTKRGREGQPAVTYSAKLTYSPRTNLSRLNMLTADEKVNLELELLKGNYTYREGKGGVAQILNALGETAAYKAGGFSALSADAQNQINALRNINTNWNEILFRPVINQEHNISLAGGSERADYYTSLGYYDEMGTVRGVSNSRFNVTLKTNYRVNKMLKLGASMFANRRKQRSYLTDTNGFTNPVYYSRLANPYFEPFAADGSYRYDTNIQGREDSSLDFNIFEERANTSNNRTDHSLMLILDAELKLSSSLKLTTQFGYQQDGYSLDRYAGENTYAMRKEKLFATYTYPDGKRTFLPTGGMHKQTEAHSSQWTWKAMAEYAHRFNKVHDLEVMAGTEVRRLKSSSLYSAAYGYDARTLTTQPVLFPTEDLGRQYPLHRETFQENAYVSWFATGSYTLMARYTLGASVRWDGSDVFGVAKKYRFLPLYSVSGLWRVSNEPFLRNSSAAKWMDNLALRLSYGLQGNIDKNTSPYLIGTFNRTTVLPGNVETVITAETAPNPNLRWEKTSNVNLGLDLSLLDNAINVSADYYYRKSTDLIGTRMLPLETGFSSTIINWASMQNEGLEVALTTRNIRTKHFTWHTNLNLGFNSNRVLRETVAENSTYPGREGYPVGAIFAYRTAGLDSDGYPLFLTNDGQKVTAQQLLKLNSHGASTLTAEQQRAQYQYMGTIDPKVSGGFINTFDYKDWQLGVNFIFNLGMKVRVQPSYSPANYDRGLNTNRDILQRWTTSNTSGTFATLMTSGTRAPEYIRYSEFNLYSMLDTWVRNNSYCRLQSLRLAYKLPKTWLSKVGIRTASLSAEARNLFVVASNYDNYLDPETMGNPFAQPLAKSFVFGLNVQF
ncbi:SusC/RagA family TonB-linked outer membrane protein [Hoylesella shahii]|uniref:TonB-linked SusC/RagA family outer membrane protein n=1 Tax=Hoylesella shahii DSM 15611 = JCM 12083 TaxID=1122991 RepID=A0A318HVT3_9BACT|nr:SusC/RagA family TonB-linked outer membrane protein [Hoylesella shahii]PXX22462.1 TonB-linked SusC/RagA family outer membrane protein [Hoylesella shahii DSM 15611 = JCM 12083]